MEETWRNAVATSGACRIECRQLHHSGESQHMACQAVPMLGPDGSVREWIGMNADINRAQAD